MKAMPQHGFGPLQNHAASSGQVELRTQSHGAGVSRAHEVGGEEGSVAGLVMVLTGLLNLFAAPLLAAGL